MAKELTVTANASTLVIRIPLRILKNSAPYAWDKAFGWGEHSLRVVDRATFAESVSSVLKAEGEGGGTLIHEMLDKAIVAVSDEGFDGVTGSTK